MIQPPEYVKIRIKGLKWIGTAWLFMFVSGIYGLFNDSAFLMWNKTRDELIRNNFIFAIVIILFVIGLYYINKAEQLEKTLGSD